MAAELIGPCRCPLCGGRARLTLAKSQLAVITCNGCNFQGFARSDRSDELLRSRLVVDEAPAAAAAAVATDVATSAGTAGAAPIPVRTDPVPVRTAATPPKTSAPAVKPAPQRAARPGWLGLNL